MSSREALPHDLNGDCDDVNQLIRLNVDRPRSAVAETLFHEITHAICRVWHWRDGDDEERIVTAFGAGWATVLADNPGLRDWLMESFE